jgi:hypothetical protein
MVLGSKIGAFITWVMTFLCWRLGFGVRQGVRLAAGAVTGKLTRFQAGA